MGNSGIGMLLGDASASMLRLWVIGAFVLGSMLVYAATKAGYLRPGERARLDRATEERQRQEDIPSSGRADTRTECGLGTFRFAKS